MVGRRGLEPRTSALACLKRLCTVIPELADGNGCAKDYSGVIEATPPIPSGGLVETPQFKTRRRLHIQPTSA